MAELAKCKTLADESKVDQKVQVRLLSIKLFFIITLQVNPYYI